MSTFDVTTSSNRDGARLGLLRCAFTGAAVAAILFVVCWVSAALGLMAASHLFLATLGGATILNLVAGLFCTAAGGALIGVLIAVVYNASAFLARR